MPQTGLVFQDEICNNLTIIGIIYCIAVYMHSFNTG